MKECPILFKDEMVRAIIEGRKTQTRRAVKPPKNIDPKHWMPEKLWDGQFKALHWPADQAESEILKCPYGQPGDRLWVRETWAMIDKDYKPADLAKATSLVYRADGLKAPNQRDPEIRKIFADRCRFPMDEIKWRPSIHMPRVVSRITLEITGVRVERLQACNEVDAIAEGAPWAACGAPQEGSHKSGFAALWESINGPGSWAANPWVWVIEFKRV